MTTPDNDLSPQLSQQGRDIDTSRSPRLGGSKKVLTDAERREQHRRFIIDMEQRMMRERPELYAEVMRQRAESEREQRIWDNRRPYGMPHPVRHPWQVFKAQWREVNENTRIDLMERIATEAAQINTSVFQDFSERYIANRADQIEEIAVPIYNAPADLSDLSVLPPSITPDYQRHRVETFHVTETGYAAQFAFHRELRPGITVRAAFVPILNTVYIGARYLHGLREFLHIFYGNPTLRACPDCGAMTFGRYHYDAVYDMADYVFTCRACGQGLTLRVAAEMLRADRDHYVMERNREGFRP